MVTILNLRPLKAKVYFLLFLFICAVNAYGQELTKLKSIDLAAPPKSVSIDRQGNFYIATERGEIDKYDQEGVLLNHFSPQKNGNASLIEAWQGPSIFLYYNDFQEYVILDRFLSNSQQYMIPSDAIPFSTLTTISGDGNLWLIDSQNLSLKKMDIPTNQIIIDNPFNLNALASNFSFSHIREYQNKLFISDPNRGVLVFDLFGNYTELIEAEGITYFNFINNEFVFLANGKAVFIDIYSRKKREIGLPNLSYKYILMENSLLICFTDLKIDLFHVNWK